MEAILTNRKWKLVSKIELIYKTKVKTSERPQIKSFRSAYELVLASWDPYKIEFLEHCKSYCLIQL